MAQKCTHKGCEKKFTDPEEECNYHPGAPIFHEGQKGWQCCKPRVLTFDEFLTIPPCTTGKHSTTAPTLAPAQTSGLGSIGQKHPEVAAPTTEDGVERYGSPKPLPRVAHAPTPPPPAEKPLEQDDPSTPIPTGTTCKRSGCKTAFNPDATRLEEECTFHPGVPIFHEGSKGYSCCKRRVLEFDQFLKIEGCAQNRHMFVGEKKSKEESELVQCRNDFYQTYEHVIISIFAKKVDKEAATIEMGEQTLKVDLPMPDNKRFKIEYPLYGKINPEESSYKIMGTKVEFKLRKADSLSWPTLRSDEATGDIIQIGKPATAV